MVTPLAIDKHRFESVKSRRRVHIQEIGNLTTLICWKCDVLALSADMDLIVKRHSCIERKSCRCSGSGSSDGWRCERGERLALRTCHHEKQWQQRRVGGEHDEYEWSRVIMFLVATFYRKFSSRSQTFQQSHNA